MLLSLAAPLTAPRPARMAPRRAATVQPRASQPRASQRAGAAAAEVSSQPRHSLSAGGGARAAPGADAPEVRAPSRPRPGWGAIGRQRAPNTVSLFEALTLCCSNSAR